MWRVIGEAQGSFRFKLDVHQWWSYRLAGTEAGDRWAHCVSNAAIKMRAARISVRTMKKLKMPM
jgi:hypothetical protein